MLGVLRGWALVSGLSLGCFPQPAGDRAERRGAELAGERGNAVVSHFALL